jgi:hypothetical protein
LEEKDYLDKKFNSKILRCFHLGVSLLLHFRESKVLETEIYDRRFAIRRVRDFVYNIIEVKMLKGVGLKMSIESFK